jgi:hypothetical protein
MKKIVFGLLLLVGGTLFLTNYLTGIATDSTDKLSSNALSQLIATDNKPEPVKNTQPTQTKPSVAEQMTNAVMKPLVDDILEITNKQSLNNAAQIENSTPKNSTTPKPPIATIKIYDKKTAKEITIETLAQLEAQHQQPTSQQIDEQRDKAAKFQAYYQKPERCASPSTHEMRIQCGNEYMRAKAKFEELWQQGKFKN